jgi:peptidase M28-like protein
MRRLALGVLGLAACAAPAPIPPAPAPTPAAAAPAAAPRANISDATLRAELTAFAAESLRGRETGTPDADRAARFLADRLRAMGAEPAGDSGYFQRVPLVREYLGPGTSFTVTEAGRASALAAGNDVVPILSPGEGMYTKHRAEGDVVFAGYGMTTSTRDDLAGLDLRDKIVVVVNGAPPGADSATRRQLESQDGIALRLQRILPQGPAGVVVLMTGQGESFYRQLAPEILRTVSAATPAPPTDDARRQIPMLLLGVARPGSPLLPAGWPSDDRARALTGRRFSGRVEVARDPFTAYNIVAVVRGSDPALSRTYVALGAHYDHIGIQPAVGGDSIANGADDDGSGSVALLEIARSLTRAAVRPLRSTLFVWHTGEEKGLLGSAHFTEHPTVPLDSVVAQINADMIGRNGAATADTPTARSGGENTLFIVGPSAAPNNQSRVLGQLVDSVNARQATPFAFNREWDSPTHPERIYFRSDHYSYAKKGIPIVFLTTGLHEDYHKVTDEPSKIDFPKLARVAALMHDVVVAVGNRRTRPR